MATVEFRYDPKNTAWFTANAAMVLKAGEPAYHDTTGLFKLGDGVTALSALSFLPTVSASTPTIQQVLTAGQVATTTIETTGFIKTGGLSTQFLKADGTIDSNVYGVGNALTSNPLSQFAATTSAQLAGVISDETGTGALVFGTSPTFTTGITTPLINGTSGTLQIGTTDLVNIGNKTTTSQRLVRIGQDTAWIDIGSQSGSTARGAIYINQATPDTTNYALSAHQTAGQTYLNGKNGVNFLANGGIIATWIASQAAFLVQPANGNTINYQFTVPNNTALTASTEVPIFKIIGGNNTWNTGAITNQKWSWITANTANFSAASIITNSYGLFVEAATAGTNATITNNWGIGVNGGGIIVRGSSGTVLDVGNTFSIFNVVASSGVCSAYNLYVTNGAMTIQTVTPTLIFNNSTVQIRRNSNSLFLDTYDDLTVRNTLSSYDMLVLRGTKTTGASTSFNFVTPTNTGQTATTNIPNFKITGSNKQWATGTVANQYWNYLTANTAAFVGASTMTNSYGLYVEEATAGTNATITNNFALGLAGSLKINDTFNIVFDTTTGTKIATATTQKLSFWNATPIVQPTTAVAAATVVSGSGGTVKHDDTFDGYTVEKVVRALRNIGLLA